MKTIKEVFSHNLKHFRGSRTQAEIAEKAGIPVRSYQNMEWGTIPQEANLDAIARALGVQPTALFLDPDYSLDPNPIYALEIIRGAFESFYGGHVSPLRREAFEGLAKVDESQVPAILGLIHMALNVGPKEPSDAGSVKKRGRPSNKRD